MNQPITIELFGRLAVTHRQEQVTRFRTQKTAALLAYLACYLHRHHDREELIERFWPDVDPEAGRTSLRTALASLRRQLEPPDMPENSVLMADRQKVRLNVDAVHVDVSAFEAALQRARRAETPDQRSEALSAAIDYYRVPLLPGFYEDWALRERARLEQVFLGALRDLIAALEEQGRYEQAIVQALRLVAGDPLEEQAHLILMGLYAKTGQIAAVKRQFHEWEQIAEKELGDPPSPEARSLLKRLTQQTPSAPGSSSASLPNPRAATPAPTQPPVPTSKITLPSSPAPLPAARRTGLPLQLTRIFGRDEELARIHALFCADNTRLLTLTGMGGTGKTRLALEVAHRLALELEGAVWFVPLADVTESERVPEHIANALSLRLTSEAEPLEQIADFLQQTPSLLVLDNFEQLPEEAA